MTALKYRLRPLCVTWKTPVRSKIGSLKVEIFDVITPLFFNHRKKLHCISSAMSMIKLLTAENQQNEKIYEIINKLFIKLKNEDWIKNYILFKKILGLILSLAWQH